MTTPIISQLQTLSQRPHARFYCPGHKGGKGADIALLSLLGGRALDADLPELPELDNLFAPAGVIKEAQELTAPVFGAKNSWFLINGSTCGVIASILATCGKGDKIVLPRNVHQSAIFGLILSGAMPIFISPEYDSNFNVCYGVSPRQITKILNENDDIKAVLIVSPSYEGICSNISEIAKITHQYNIPLLVDEAHGAHFHFHDNLPSSALSCGADVVIQSTHKVLGALTQASMIHLQGDLVKKERISEVLRLLQSSSPNYLLLASLDAVREQMAREGKELLTKTINLATLARNELEKFDYLQVLQRPSPQDNFFDLDITRLTINVNNLSLNGYEIDDIFHRELGVSCELPTATNLTFIISIGNTETDIKMLINACEKIAPYQTNQVKNYLIPPQPLSHVKMSPRQAFWASKISVTFADSINHICAETICPYPPGIPLLMPGEVITREIIDYLTLLQEWGATVTGADHNFIQIVKSL
ncbi:MAG: aminotransferase class I/II-fold pyridoxal phosphate-dependent enzyme [Cyanobacterium sp. T60_A2020_053]|nr:aminotransferase class I/II-fold pyridoxal phosphate-dependent enzyme [Cyanobacterium sp. T60_A2020_053]